MKKAIPFVMAMLMLTAGAKAQDLEGNITTYTSANGKRYLQPLADIFGANLNSGFYHTARIPKIGLTLRAGLVAMYAPISEKQRTFTPTEEYGWIPEAGTKLPTVFGDKESVTIEGIEFPGGVWSENFFPLAIPQLTVGGIMGTEATIRWIEYDLGDDIGKIKLTGWGLRHSLSQYILLCPVDIAIGYWRQKFEIGSLIEATAVYWGVQASKSISLLTFYGGYGFEKSTLGFAYDHQETGETYAIRFDLEGANTARTTLGISINLAVLKLWGDISMAKQTTYSAGIGIGF